MPSWNKIQIVTNFSPSNNIFLSKKINGFNKLIVIIPLHLPLKNHHCRNFLSTLPWYLKRHVLYYTFILYIFLLTFFLLWKVYYFPFVRSQSKIIPGIVFYWGSWYDLIQYNNLIGQLFCYFMSSSTWDGIVRAEKNLNFSWIGVFGLHSCNWTGIGEFTAFKSFK